MPKSYKIALVSVFSIVFCLNTAVSQEKQIYKDVLLDGKPAILNTETGEVTLKKVKTDPTSKKVVQSKLKPKVERAKAVQDSTTISKSDFHTVKAGETLFGLSKHYNTTLTKLKNANDLSTTLIRVGQVLLVKNFENYIKASKKEGVWTVSKGDTLYDIAKRNNLTVFELKKLNNLESNTIYIGQKLRLK
ncbi:MAG: LysM peptidoglycan-binding domain-containing protein [Jejuia sp.]